MDGTMQRLLNRKKIKKIDIDLFQGKSDKELQQEYEEKRKEFINETIIKFNSSEDKAGAMWNRRYPKGFVSWKPKYRSLNAVGEQALIDKVNEIISVLNKRTG